MLENQSLSSDSIQVTVPHILTTPLGLFPRIKSLLVVGLFEIGGKPDAYQSFVSLETAQLLFGLDSKVDGVQLLTDDLYNVASIVKDVKKKNHFPVSHISKNLKALCLLLFEWRRF